MSTITENGFNVVCPRQSMKLLIDGEWRDPERGSYIDKYNPSTGETMEKIPAADRNEVDSAMDAATDAFWPWYELGSKSRSKILVRAANLIEQKRKELEDILVNENGKRRIESVGEVDGVLDQIYYYAGFERKLPGDLVEGDNFNRKILQYKVPYGVVLALTPWNFPAAMVARKLAPALLTGNTVVLKPSSDTPLSAEWITRKFVEAGIPKGVLNLITGRGSEIGDYMVSHPRVSVITMTGSTGTGQRIMEKASRNMAKLILELGGKAPFIVWNDADQKSALKSLLWAKFWNTGQSCIAAERVYVKSDIYDSFVGKFVRAARNMSVGNPETADMGPLINSSAVKTTEEFVESAKESGARILAGGKKPDLDGKFNGGYFYLPTVMEEEDQKSELFQEEVFGPVTGVMSVEDLDQVIDLANDSKYGLASYLFSNDFATAMKVAEKIRFGELYINMPGPESSQGYHTGFRLTGQAGEGSTYGIGEYLKLKNVYMDYSGKEVHIDTVREDLVP